MSKRKLHCKFIIDKCNAIKDIDSGLSNKDASVKYGVPRNTISTWVKNKEKYLKALECSRSKKKRSQGHFEKLDKVVLRWFISNKRQNIPLGGKIVKKKALAYAKELGYGDFKASSGWLDRWKRRNGVFFKTFSGESNAVSTDMTAAWNEAMLPILLSNYSLENVYNADEFGLYFRYVPNKSFHLKSEKYSGGKDSKNRITGLVAANAIGEKLPIFAIGNAKSPASFKGIKALPCRYRAQRNSWIDSALFEEWVRELNTKVKAEQRKIALIVDHSPAHLSINNLSHVTLVFVPPNTTSVSQPMEQGIVTCLKAHYRKRLVKAMIHCLEHNEPLLKVSLLKALQLLVSAWNDVSRTTIVNCFQKADIFKKDPSTAVNDDVDDPFKELNHGLRELQEKDSSLVSESMTAEDLVQADDQVLTTGSLHTDEYTLEEALTTYDVDVDGETEEGLDGETNERLDGESEEGLDEETERGSDEETEEGLDEEVRVPSLRKVEDAIEILKNYSLFSKNRGIQMQDAIYTFETLMNFEKAESSMK